MRVVSRRIFEALESRKSLTVGNTRTDGESVFLHGNRIFWRRECGYGFSLCGWATVTTRSRLNDLFRLADVDAHLYQERHETFLGTNGEVEPADDWAQYHVDNYDRAGVTYAVLTMAGT